MLNTAEGRTWPKNLRRDGHTTLTVQNLENPYEYLTITGHVVEDTTEGADAHIDRMAQKYLGQDTYPFRQPGEERVIFRIAPDRVHRFIAASRPPAGSPAPRALPALIAEDS